jgi:hydrogenase large subunit
LRVVDAALGQLGAGRESLNSTLAALCRAAESVLLARRLEVVRRVAGADQVRRYRNIQSGSMGSKTWPKSAKGVGFTEAARGTLSHWVEIDNGRIVRYQCVVPSTWNSSGRDAEGQPGPFEHALAAGGHHPLEDPQRPLEVLRTVHSFDPCQSCAVHLLDLAGGTAVEVNVS